MQLPPALAGLTDSQAGLLSVRQLRAHGVSRAAVRSQVRAHRWRRVHPGVYVTFTGPLSDLARVWAALLYAGEDAVASHDCAEWLHGLRVDLPSTVSVSVPHGGLSQPSRPGVQVRQSRRLSARRHPSRTPPQCSLEATVLDLVDDALTARQVIDVVLRACQQRRTTADRLSAAAGARNRLRWRSLLGGLLLDVGDGVTTPLERRYVTDVERAHGLPHGYRNKLDVRGGRRRYRDVRYRRWRLVVELDGRAAHPEDERELDDLRDNEVRSFGEQTLRYGWRSVTIHPCLTAGQVAGLPQHAGWRGQPAQCGPTCTVDAESGSSDGEWVAL